MIQTETSKAKLLLVGVQNICGSPKICPNNDGLYLSYFGTAKQEKVQLPEGNWTILNTLDEVTEGEAAKVMPSFDNIFDNETYFWVNEHGRTVMVETAKDALVYGIATSLGIEGKTIILYELK